MAGSEVLLTYKRKRLRSGRCSIGSASVIVNHQGELAEGNNIESCTDVSEPAPEEKRLCSDIVKLQHSLSSPKASREEDKSNYAHDPSEVLDGGPVEGKNKKASYDPVSLHDGVSSSIKNESCSYVSPCSAILPTSGEQDKMCSDGTDANVENMPVDMVPKNKLNLPLITFRRRSKQKRHSETPENDSTLPVASNCILATGDCKTTGTLLASEATSKSDSVDASEFPYLPKTKLISDSALTKSQEKKTTREVDSSCVCSCLTSENGSSKPVYGTLGNNSGTGQSVGAGSCSTFEIGSSKPVHVTLENTSLTGQSHGAGSCSTFDIGSEKLRNTSGAGQSHGANSSQDSGFAFTSLQAKNSVDFQETPSVEKSPPGLSHDNTNRLGKTDVILSSKSAEAALDLSICPLAEVDSKKALEQEVHGQPILGSLLRPINGNLNSPILGVPVKDHESVLLHNKPENRNPNLTHQQQNHCSSAETIIEKNNEVNFASALNRTCLQLFPENVSDQRNKWQERPVHSVSEEKPINLHQIRTQARTCTPVSSHYLGLPIEPRLKKLACNLGLSQRQNVGIQSTGLVFPDQSSSFTRHQMILDKIATRSISLKGIKNDITPTPWSEEELDCLWIGVRRYGRGNWDAMLRDPRLHFLPWRAPTELAAQWQMEQHKLLNRLSFCNPRHLKAPNDVINGNLNSVDEVQLSLGDLYSEPKDGLLTRLGYLNAAQNDVTRVTRRVHESYVAELNPIYHSMANQRRAQGVINTSFPHWLKVTGVVPRTNSGTALHSVPQSMNSTSSINPVSENIAMVHKGNNATQPGEAQADTMNKEEVIIINSDVSSEETISDDD